MLSPDEISALANPALKQYFLVSPAKLAQLVAATGILPQDHVVELGAGIGTVARALPRCESLTVVEYDERLIRFLHENVPHATVINGDGLALIARRRCDVLLGNLPNSVTESLIDLLPSLSFRTAVLSVGESTDVDRIGPRFSWSEVAMTTGDDFQPPQPSVSRLVRITRNHVG